MAICSDAIIDFRKIFFSVAESGRTSKHVPDMDKGSSAKRINMFLRWMVRRDKKGVDFGIWNGIPMNALYIPLDVHTGTCGPKTGIAPQEAKRLESGRLNSQARLTRI